MVFVSEKIRQLRREKGYSLEQMARMLRVKTGHKVSRNSIHQWEQGKNFPSVKSLMAVAEFYGKEINFFFDKRY